MANVYYPQYDPHSLYSKQAFVTKQAFWPLLGRIALGIAPDLIGSLFSGIDPAMVQQGGLMSPPPGLLKRMPASSSSSGGGISGGLRNLGNILRRGTRQPSTAPNTTQPQLSTYDMVRTGLFPTTRTPQVPARPSQTQPQTPATSPIQPQTPATSPIQPQTPATSPIQPQTPATQGQPKNTTQAFNAAFSAGSRGMYA